MSPRKPSRRDFLRIMGVGAGAALLAACETKVEVTREVEKVVKETVVEKETVLETVVVEGTPEVMEQEVTRVVEKEVEVEKVVTATPPPALSGDIMLWTFPYTDDDKKKMWEPINEQFFAAYPDIHIEHSILPWSGRREKMLTAYAGGEAPDIAYVNADTISLWGTNDVLLPLEDLVSQEIWDDIPQDNLPGLTWNGHLLIVPMDGTAEGQAGHIALLEEVGWNPEEPPVTWDEHRELGAMAKEKGYFLQSLPVSTIGFWFTSVWQAGGNTLNEDQTKSLIDQEAGLEAAGLYKEYYENEWVPVDYAVPATEGQDTSAYFIQGVQVLTQQNDSSAIGQIVDASPTDWEFVVLPPRKNKEQVSIGNAGGWGIFNTTENAEACAVWLNFMLRPDICGFYGSAGNSPPVRLAALKYWQADPVTKDLYEKSLPYSRITLDFFLYYQERKLILIPHLTAIALGEETVEEAMTKAAAEIDTMIQQQLEASE